MEDKLEEVIRQYPFRVKSKKRTRGALLLDTGEGTLLLKDYGASPSRIELEEDLKRHLSEQGYSYIDITIKNVNGEYRTRDKYGKYWVVRRWYQGGECDIHDADSVCKAAAHLGRIHQLMQMPTLQNSVLSQGEELPEELERHNRELKRVRSYIRGKRQKNEMEICLLNSFPEFYQQACLAQSLLQECGYEQLWQDTMEQGRVRHGNYTYHNVMFGENDVITTGFEKAEIGLQITDLYSFLRKVMEKNEWCWPLGEQMIHAYESQRCLEDSKKKTLYVLLLYPYKYWKLVNFYYNGRKSWIPAKNLEKLVRIRKQEEERLKFLDQAKTLLF